MVIITPCYDHTYTRVHITFLVYIPCRYHSNIVYISLCSTGVWVPHIPKIGGIDDAEVRITACTLYMCVLSVCLGDMYMYMYTSIYTPAAKLRYNTTI